MSLFNAIADSSGVYDLIADKFSKTREYSGDNLDYVIKYTKDNDKVLDLGCGNGRLYQLLEEKQIQYVGVDKSEEFIKIAKQKYPSADFKVGDIVNLEFLQDSFDIVYCLAVFHHLDNNQARTMALKEIRRVLKSGGLLVMTNWNLLSKWGIGQVEKGKYTKWGNNDFVVPWKNRDGKVLGERFYHGFGVDELDILFKQTGFVVLENMYVNKGEKSDQEQGDNVLSVVKKP